uniref:Glycosyltransferase n=1 Tax=viral metagenome TaxID=1070528 RepID=A0A6C0IF13_9ZZZZ
MNSYGFIITRHVNSEKTNKYWNHCLKCLRTLYPYRKIVIIDDNSNPVFLKAEFNYKNIEIINSEFKGRGELLPYYYYLKNKFFDNAIIIHDSIFFHKRINFDTLIGNKVLPLWFFYPDRENIDNTIRISRSLKNSFNIQNKIALNDLVIGMNHNKWFGCFGVQSFINHDFLTLIQQKYNITNMISTVTCRLDRCCLERILGCIFYTESPEIIGKKSLLGDIMKYHKWGYTYDEYENDFKTNKVPKVVVKVWTGR